MKNSQYNVYFKNQKNYIFNLWKGSIIALDDQNYNALINQNYELLNDEVIRKLINLNIITNSDDEFASLLSENKTYSMNKRDTYALCIAPTTACNARCPYCFEKGIPVEKMSKETADKIIDHIVNNYCGRKVKIRWFGGEPLLAVDIIDYVSTKLNEHNIIFESSMISNGYYIEENIDKMTSLWNLKRIQITLDGLHQDYDGIKQYVNDSSAFNKIIKNIHLIGSKNITVAIRLNFDPLHISKTLDTIVWLDKEFGDYKCIYSYCNHIMDDEYVLPNDLNPNPYLMIFRKYEQLSKMNKLKSYRISRKYQYCACWDNEYYNYAPNGSKYKCEHYINKGNNFTDESFKADVESKRITTFIEECRNCKCFPICAGGCVAERNRNKDAGCLQIKNCIEEVVKMFIINCIEGGKKHGSIS